MPLDDALELRGVDAAREVVVSEADDEVEERLDARLGRGRGGRDAQDVQGAHRDLRGGGLPGAHVVLGGRVGGRTGSKCAVAG